MFVVPDATLLERWRTGDAVAGNQLFKRHFRAIYCFFRNKVSGDLDDLVQATFLRCSQSKEKIRATGTFRSYLFTIARNILVDHYRKRRRDLSAEEVSASKVIDLGATPTAMMAEKQEHNLLLSALRSLQLDEQVALELMYWERLTGREIAEVLGVPEGTARTRIRSARTSLEVALTQLSRSPEVLASTLDNLERWSASLREYLAQSAT